MSAPSKEVICAGIVSYNPDIERLLENVNAIREQVSKVFVFENGSGNCEAVSKALAQLDGVELIACEANMGIAYALNALCDAAIEGGFKHIVTLDQDSVSVPGMVEELAKHVGDSVGVVSPQIVDRNKEGLADVEKQLDHRLISVKDAARKGVITSGCLTNLEAYTFVGKFDESFFIDYVDYDFNKRLLLEGYSIIRSGNTCLIHECGDFKPTWLWTPRKGQDGKWKLERFYSFGHSAFRCYYKSRNRILYTRKYKPTNSISGFEGSRQILPQILLTLLFEDNKAEKLKEFKRGINDGKKAEVVPYAIKKGNDR